MPKMSAGIKNRIPGPYEMKARNSVTPTRTAHQTEKAKAPCCCTDETKAARSIERV